ncbi:unnamed protein product, partial [Mesorhabditis spiculigera]
MAAATAGPSELQQLGRDDLLELLKKQAEQQKALKEQLAIVTKEKDDALAQLSVASTSHGRAESPENDRKQELEELRLEFEAKLAKEKFAAQEVNSSLKAMQMALADYDKQIKKFKEEKASKASKLESALKDRDELSTRLGIVEAELANTKQFSDHLEKALECAKAEAEELRLQKQDAESQKIELMQVKMDEDSHSSWEVVDLTNELAQNSQQIETLRSSLVSVESKQFSDHLEKALKCAKAEAEELRLQKQDAESQRNVELMRMKIKEDSHSSMHSLQFDMEMDLTNELSRTSQQIETLGSSLASVKTEPSFCDFTVAVQHAILRYMDVKDFFKTAITSKKMLEYWRHICR